MQVTRGRVALIFTAMQNMGTLRVKKRFAYGLVKNKTIIEEEIKAIREAEKDLIPYENERIELCKKHSALVNGGEPKISDGVYQGLTKNQNFLNDLRQLDIKYEKELKESQEFLSEKTNIDFIPISIEDFPDEISSMDMEILLPLVKE